jgi:hypothetical protein
MSTVEWFRFGFDCFQTTAIIIGGLVALYEYRRFRQYGAKAQLDLDFDLYPVQKYPGNFLLDIRPTIKNMGRVRQKFPIIELWALSPAQSDMNTAFVGRNRFRFSRELVSRRNIVHDPADPYFVDPGVIQEFPYQVVISEPGDFLQVVVRFFYQVSWPAYVRLCIVARLGWSHRWQNPKKIERLKKYKVDEYHLTSKVKQV